MSQAGTDQSSVPLGAAAVAALALFDVGQQFMRPVLGFLSGQLDVALLVSQALTTLLMLAFVRHADADCAPGSLRTIRTFAVLLAALCVLSQVVVLSSKITAWGTLPAYLGTVLCGMVFGMGFVLCLGVFATGIARGRRYFFSNATQAGLAALVALAVGRAATMAVRILMDETGSFILGVVCLDVAVALLVALAVLATRADGLSAAERPEAGEARGHLPTLLGIGLFSLLFGLTTQVHNNEQAYSSFPDYLSSLLTVVVLLALAARVAVIDKPLRIDRLFIATVPVIAAVMAASPLFWSDVSDVSDALVKSFFNVYFAALFVYVIQQGSADSPARRSPLFLPALALGILWSGVALGSVAGFAFVTAIEESETAVTSAFLAATWVCVIAMVPLSRAARPERVVPGAPTVVYVDRTEEQVRRLSELCGLSARERDVCVLLVQGRSAARIGDELSLSENTVKTHLQNIYGKAGVHTKQELLDRIAAVGVPEAAK